MRGVERTQNGLVGLFSAVAFAMIAGLLAALAVTLIARASSSLGSASTLELLQI